VKSLFDLTPEELGDSLVKRGAPRYRAKQILSWVYGRGAESFDAIDIIPKALRVALQEELLIYRSRIRTEQRSHDGTLKLLLQWPDGATSECVMIPDGRRRTACISSQVGCPVGCVFCASGLDGLTRQLCTGEIVEQAMRIRGACGESRLSNVVFMGLGEPLANYDAVIGALRTITSADGLAIGSRKITISTVGLPNQMRRLADERLQVTLALSLHAPTDELREEIIPWAKRVTIEDLVDACRYYFDRTGREVTIEYILLGKLNDHPAHARQLARVSKRMRCNVNLIRYNPVDGLPYRQPSDESAAMFAQTLRSEGVNVHERRSRGQDIDAACGQLRRRSDRAPT